MTGNNRHEEIAAIGTKRNDKCPCGSKKKYKKCCMVEEKPTKILQFHDPKNMTDTDMEKFADGLIEELQRLKEIEKWAGAVFNSRTPKTIVTVAVTVPAKIMNTLGIALAVPSNLCEAAKEEPESTENDDSIVVG